MNSETTTTSKTFLRKQRIGLSLLETELKKSVHVEIKGYDLFTTKDGREIPKFDVINLMTGESQTMWVDGGLRGQLSFLGGPEAVVGKCLEIVKTGQKELEGEKGETYRVNTYDVFEISNGLD